MDDDEVERVTVALPTCYADEIRAAVAAGEYPDVDAAVEKAVGHWWADRAIARIGVDRLRRHLEKAIAEGDPQPMDFDALRAELKQRWSEKVVAAAEH